MCMSYTMCDVLLEVIWSVLPPNPKSWTEIPSCIGVGHHSPQKPIRNALEGEDFKNLPCCLERCALVLLLPWVIAQYSYGNLFSCPTESLFSQQPQRALSFSSTKRLPAEAHWCVVWTLEMCFTERRSCCTIGCQTENKVCCGLIN